MNTKLIALTLLLAAFAIPLRASSPLSTEEARKHLRNGAALVDVRTPAEYKSGNLPGAINIPVETIQTGITNHVTDKGRVILLHCRSGRRSAVAEKELRQLGYTNAFNIGSFQQAERVVSPSASK